ncbi:MAG: hypothetical protein ACQEQE_11185 [Bacillota bacterium]
MNKTKIYKRFSELKRELKNYDPKTYGWTIYYDIQEEGSNLFQKLKEKGLSQTDQYQYYLFQKQLSKTEGRIEKCLEIKE